MHVLPLVLLLLATSVLGVLLFRRMGLPPVLGYLLVGSLIGPHALDLFEASDAAGSLAEFGVVFLMFSIGLEFSLPRLYAMKRTVFGLGGLQVVLSMLVGGGLGALQAMVISTGLPFTLVLLVMCWAILKGLMSEKR